MIFKTPLITYSTNKETEQQRRKREAIILKTGKMSYLETEIYFYGEVKRLLERREHEGEK